MVVCINIKVCLKLIYLYLSFIAFLNYEINNGIHLISHHGYAYGTCMYRVFTKYYHTIYFIGHQDEVWGAYVIPRCRRLGLVTVFVAGSVSKLRLVSSRPHLYGWCIWTYLWTGKTWMRNLDHEFQMFEEVKMFRSKLKFLG